MQLIGGGGGWGAVRLAGNGSVEVRIVDRDDIVAALDALTDNLLRKDLTWKAWSSNASGTAWAGATSRVAC